jgi:predicted dehydrogenase
MRPTDEVAVAVVGVGLRCQRVYGPLLAMLPGVWLAGVYGPTRERAAAVAARFGARAYQRLDDLLDDPSVEALIACARWSANPELYRQLARWDRPMLLETPLAADPAEALAVAEALRMRSGYADIAEQYHRRPAELLKRELLARGEFGTVGYAFSDGVGHEYHGVSLLRSYLGWPSGTRRVLAVQRDLPLTDHVTHRNVFFDSERVQHAIIEFDNDTIGAYRWSWLSYESPIRARRIAGFEGSCGAAWGEELVVLGDPERPHALHYRLEHRTRVVEGLEVPTEVAVLIGDRCIAKWQNPHPNLPLDTERITASAFVDQLARTVSDPGTEPLYPVSEAAVDHAVVGSMYAAFLTSGPLKSPASEARP